MLSSSELKELTVVSEKAIAALNIARRRIEDGDNSPENIILLEIAADYLEKIDKAIMDAYTESERITPA